MLKPFFFLITISFFLSCKNSQKESQKESNTVQIQAKSLRVEFSFRTSESDVFTIKMNNIEVDDLQQMNIHIFEDVIPTSKEDRIIAEFNTNNFPQNIIINLGVKEIKEVEIQSISISYGDNYYSFDTITDIKNYFVFNKFIEVSDGSSKISTKRVDGKHNPAIYVRQNLIRLLKKK